MAGNTAAHLGQSRTPTEAANNPVLAASVSSRPGCATKERMFTTLG
jgi:hypothetical protein